MNPHLIRCRRGGNDEPPASLAQLLIEAENRLLERLIPGNGIDVNLGKGSAVLQASNVPVFDYGNIPNALFGGPSTITGQTSFTVVWSGVNERLNIKNTDPIYGGFGGEFVRNSAQMEWTATAGDYQFVSAPLATSASLWAELGHERNGIFFRQ